MRKRQHIKMLEALIEFERSRTDADAEHLKSLRKKYQGYGASEYVVKVWAGKDVPNITCTFTDLDLAAHWRKTQMNEMIQAVDGEPVHWRITERISRSVDDEGDNLMMIGDIGIKATLDELNLHTTIDDVTGDD